MATWQDIKAKKAALDAKRPLTPRTLAVLDAWWDVELVYSSNAIEGNALTRSETAIVLEKGLTVRGKPLKDHLEAIDHKDALDYVRALAMRDEAIREGDVREIHRLVLSRSSRDEAGRYSRHVRRIQGSAVRFPDPLEIPAVMGEFGQWLGAAASTPGTAFEAHARLVSIHPFSDGNGRTARLLMNLVLFKGGYPPVTVRPQDREDYIDSLELRQISGDSGPFDTLMLDRLNASLDDYLGAIAKELEARNGQPSPKGNG